jgi:hypothetical protein
MRVAILILGLCIAPGARAQEQVDPSLLQRMRAFGSAVDSVDKGRIASFFPRRGEWTLVRIIYRDGGMTDSIESRQVPARATRRLLAGVREPDCGATSPPPDDQLSFETLFPWRSEERWRVRSPTRFEAVEEIRVSTPAFIEWRRERGGWVISTMSEDRLHFPRLLGVDAQGGRPDPVVYPPAMIPLASESRFARGEGWYENHEPIVWMGRRFTKYGLPRILRSGEVTRLGSYRRVGIYVESGTTGFQEVIYTSVTSTEFQPYQNTGVC